MPPTSTERALKAECIQSIIKKTASTKISHPIYQKFNNPYTHKKKKGSSKKSRHKGNKRIIESNTAYKHSNSLK